MPIIPSFVKQIFLKCLSIISARKGILIKKSARQEYLIRFHRLFFCSTSHTARSGDEKNQRTLNCKKRKK